jgi:hypothetical protein
VIAWCLEAHDLVLAKLAAGREHDFEFAREAVRVGVVSREQLLLGLDLMPTSHRRLTSQRLKGLLAKLDQGVSAR